jgi:hypothetical protein
MKDDAWGGNMSYNGFRASIALGLTLAVGACGPRNVYISPYGDPEITLQNQIGYPPEQGIPPTNLGTLVQLNYAAQACAEFERQSADIKVAPPLAAIQSGAAVSGKAPPLPPQQVASPRVDIGNAKCPVIYQHFFEEVASESDLACDSFIEKLYAEQQKTSLASDITNITGGVLSAATAIFSLGSIVGGITGLTVSALNSAFDSYSSIFLFTIPAGDIRILIYTKKQSVRDAIAANSIDSLYEARERIRDYFLACTPASVQQFVTKAIHDKAEGAVPFLSNRFQNEAARKNALATIVEAGREMSKYLGSGRPIAPQEVAAMFYILASDKAQLAGDAVAGTTQTIETFLKDQGLYDASQGGFQFNSAILEKEATKIANGKPVTDEHRRIAKERLNSIVLLPLMRVGANSGTGALDVLKGLLKDITGKGDQAGEAAGPAAPAGMAGRPAVEAPTEGLLLPPITDLEEPREVNPGMLP